MTTTTRRAVLQLQSPACERASRRLYDAEVALHIARQTGVDEWVSAAADRLHDAVVAYRSALEIRGPSDGTPQCV
jgi:hypothetical protein